MRDKEITWKGYRIALTKGRDGWIVARSLDYPGAITQGKNEEEAKKNLVEAIEAIKEISHTKYQALQVLAWIIVGILIWAFYNTLF